MNLILITGFLGSGKTTLVRRLISLYQGLRISLIINEFGNIGVDGGLLADSMAEMIEITGGSVFCSCRIDAFDDALTRCAAHSPDLILVESSGLSDPTAIKTVVGAHPEITYQGSIALCDALRIEKALAVVRASVRQLSVADLILLNKVDLVSTDKAAQLKTDLSERFPAARVETTTQAQFQPEWLDSLRAKTTAEPLTDDIDITLQKAEIQIAGHMPAAQCLMFLKLFAEDTFRMKGFVRLREGWYLAQGTGADVSLLPIEQPETAQPGIVALAGRGMPLRKSLHLARAQYADAVISLQFG